MPFRKIRISSAFLQAQIIFFNKFPISLNLISEMWQILMMRNRQASGNGRISRQHERTWEQKNGEVFSTSFALRDILNEVIKLLLRYSMKYPFPLKSWGSYFTAPRQGRAPNSRRFTNGTTDLGQESDLKRHRYFGTEGVQESEVGECSLFLLREGFTYWIP